MSAAHLGLPEEAVKLIMTDREFEQLRDFVYSRTCIYYMESQRSLFERKLRPRALALHCSSFQTYYELLRDTHPGSEEFNLLIDLLTVHETSFFRIKDHFNGLQHLIFPKLLQRRSPDPLPLRIWSAGCSTGEEAYSIGMAFLETLSSLPQYAGSIRKVRVIATDISSKVLQKATAGIFTRKEVQKVAKPLLDKYFILYNAHYYIREDVKQLVTFSRLNLSDLESLSAPVFDIIFCRNVLIYFGRHAQVKLLTHLLSMLPEGGYLFLGDAESIHTFPESAKQLEFIESGNSMIYQKRGVQF